jgi:hypothetical protein
MPSFEFVCLPFQSCGFVEFATHSALQAAIAASPIELVDNIKIVVEERRKSSKAAEARTGKQLIMDRRLGTKPEDSRPGPPKKAGRAHGPGSHKQRTE